MATQVNGSQSRSLKSIYPLALAVQFSRSACIIEHLTEIVNIFKCCSQTTLLCFIINFISFKLKLECLNPYLVVLLQQNQSLHEI